MTQRNSDPRPHSDPDGYYRIEYALRDEHGLRHGKPTVLIVRGDPRAWCARGLGCTLLSSEPSTREAYEMQSIAKRGR
jgi:hypothetical protein